MSDDRTNITRLLHAAAAGDRADLDALASAIYDDLRRLAVAHLRRERADHTLQPTALVHEAYVRLIDQRSTGWNDRAHFFAVASTLIRRILVDHARERRAAKRGGGAERVALDEAHEASAAPDVDLILLDEALAELAELDERQAKVVELRFFGGLSVAETAEVLGIGRRSVDRDWQCARAWLYCRLQGEEQPGDG